MKQQRWYGWIASGVVTLVTAATLCAQDGPPPRPQGRDEGPDRAPARREGMFRPMMMPAQLFATGDYVFVLRGNMLYKYDVKELKLQGKTELEAPIPPPQR